MSQRPTSRRQWWIAAAVAAAALAAAIVLVLRGTDEDLADGPGEGEAPVDGAGQPVPEERYVAKLYFPDGGMRLHSESRELPVADAVDEQIAALIGALIAGPRDDRYLSPLPDEVTLRKVYVVDDATVFLDLESPNGEPPPASGSRRELLTVYSLVNTVLLNTEGPQGVVLLWNGQQPQTFAGHLSTARPLRADSSLIASAR